jgi:integrase/recombinase XerD
LREKTIVWYRSLLNSFSRDFGDRELDSLTVADLRLYLVRLRERYTSDDTIHDHNRALRRFFGWCAAEYDMTNPMTRIGRTKQPKPKLPKAVTAPDVVKLMQACDQTNIGKRDKAIIAFLMDTGCRAAGLVGLKLDDLDMERETAYVVEKGNELRAVFFTVVTTEILQAWLDVRDPANAYVFYGQSGEPLLPNGLLQMLGRLKRKARVTGRVNPHAFRHGFARDYVLNGGELATLSRLLGHKSTEVTAWFYAVFASKELKAAHDRYSPMQNLRSVMDDEEKRRNKGSG